MSSPRERRPLPHSAGYFAAQNETDADADVDDADVDDADVDDASLSRFSSGCATQYATFPNIQDHRLTRAHEKLLSRSTIASFAASLVLLLVASLLVATGRHNLHIEVDAGATVGIVSSLFFAANYALPLGEAQLAAQKLRRDDVCRSVHPQQHFTCHSGRGKLDLTFKYLHSKVLANTQVR
jgi:hypothetical protein